MVPYFSSIFQCEVSETRGTKPYLGVSLNVFSRPRQFFAVARTQENVQHTKIQALILHVK